MLGTVINVVTIVGCTLVGILFGKRFSENLREVLFTILGVFIIYIGVDFFLQASNEVVCLISAVLGAWLGEVMKLDDKVEAFGVWLNSLRDRFGKDRRSSTDASRERFIQGFVTATAVFLIGPIGILASFQAGLNGDMELLIVKSVIDGVSCIIFGSLMGIGVAFSALPVLVYQGALTLFAARLSSVLTDSMIAEMTGTGGILLGLIAASSLLGIKKIRTTSTVPAILIAPVLIWLVEKFA